VPNSYFELSGIDSTGDMTLVVAQRVGKKLKGFRIAIHDDVRAALKEACDATLTMLGERARVAYASDIEFDPATQYLDVPPSILSRPTAATGNEDQPTAAIETDPEAHSVLEDGSSLPLLEPAALKKRSFLFYAVIVGNQPAQRVSFVTQWNPYKVSLTGRVVTFFGDRLRKIDDPILVFQQSFHLVVAASGIAVLNSAAFETIFRDIEVMQQRVPTWVDGVTSALPLTDGAEEQILAACTRDSRLAKRARALFESGTLTGKNLTAARLHAELKNQGLEADRMVNGGKLHIEGTDVPILLKLLSEGLWKGWITDTAWEASAKAPRQP
jgi:hypothetical protein